MPRTNFILLMVIIIIVVSAGMAHIGVQFVGQLKTLIFASSLFSGALGSVSYHYINNI